MSQFSEEDLVWWAGELFFIYSFNNNNDVVIRNIKNKNDYHFNISTERLTKASEVKTVTDWRTMMARSKLELIVGS